MASLHIEFVAKFLEQEGIEFGIETDCLAADLANYYQQFHYLGYPCDLDTKSHLKHCSLCKVILLAVECGE